MNRHWWYLIPLMAACISTLAVADDRADYNRRSAERYIAMFRLADLNKDNVVTVGEAQGIIELQAHLNDIPRRSPKRRNARTSGSQSSGRTR